MLVKKRRKKPKGESFQLNHFLVPHHELLKEAEANKALEEIQATREQLPRIDPYDPAIAYLNAKEGDVIKIKRTGEAIYYRVVIRD